MALSVHASNDAGRKRAGRVLVVDDRPSMLTTLAMLLGDAGYEAETASTAAMARELGATRAYDLILIDLRLGREDGVDVLRAIKQAQPLTEVIVMTAYGTIETAVRTMKLGAFDYLQKPFSEAELLIKVAKAIESRQLRTQIQLFARDFKDRYHVSNIVGRSRTLRRVIGELVRLAPSESSILISGESGTGKELLARAVHANSGRAERPFVVVDCASTSEAGLAAELYGRASSAAAAAESRGLLEDASGGTVFLNGLTDTSLALQSSLLRSVETGETRRIGATRTTSIDVRLIASSRSDPASALADGSIHPDLYYHCGLFQLPALRERREDIPLLIEHFLTALADSTGLRTEVAPELLGALADYDFPGNVRELKAMVERAAFLANGEPIGPEHLPSSVQRAPRESSPPRPSVFISYSHCDWEWLKRLQVHLSSLERRGQIERWDDTKLRPGEDWRDNIRASLDRASIAILLVSADWLASDFVAEHELPPLLQAARSRGLRILTVIVEPCLFEEHPQLAPLQAVNDPSRPLCALPRHEQEQLLANLARRVIEALQAPTPQR